MIVVAVPTPVDDAHLPDFGPMLSACRSIGPNLKDGVTIVFESTVYPGATEEVCVPELERVSGKTLDALLAERVYGPLGMRDTQWNPPESMKLRIAPTEIQEFRGGQVWGVVHDENAWAMGGVSGHAGLFSSARDLGVFTQMLLNGGEYVGVRVLHPETIARWTARQRPDAARALGWETPSAPSSSGHYFSPRSFGHTGFTGTSIWADPEKQLFVVLLTNRVDPSRDNTKVGPLRRAVADAVQRAVLDAPLRMWEADSITP